MPITGPNTAYHFQHRFFVLIEGIGRSRFKTVSELKKTREVIEHREGGTIIPYKAPGTMTVEPVTLERGVITGDVDLYNWFQQGGDAAISAPQGPGIGTGIGLGQDGYKRNMTIIQIDLDGAELRAWGCKSCWVSEFTAGAWDNDASEVVIESAVIQMDDWELLF